MNIAPQLQPMLFKISLPIHPK